MVEQHERRQRVFEIIDAVPDIAEKPDAKRVELRGGVRLDGVSFSYEPNKPVLKNVSFEVKPGEMLGIVGKSGAGKSTLVNLISRLYDPDEGGTAGRHRRAGSRVFLTAGGGGHGQPGDLYFYGHGVGKHCLRAADATREEIVRAAVAASAHGFICRLPHGYDTVIGSGGGSCRAASGSACLSPGPFWPTRRSWCSTRRPPQWTPRPSGPSRIPWTSSSRADHHLYRPPPLTLRSADHLIVLDNGELVESGTHAELLEKRGVYYKLLQLQTKALAMRGSNRDGSRIWSILRMPGFSSGIWSPGMSDDRSGRNGKGGCRFRGKVRYAAA